MTQEQLAEILNVTVGAVSKWENGVNRPDIELLPVLADVFHVSIDQLLGHEERSSYLDKKILEILDFANREKYKEASEIAEKLVMKYPNHFKSNKVLADVYYSICFSDGNCGKEYPLKAIFYYKKCIELYNDLYAAAISKEELFVRIASLYALESVGEYYKAIRIVERYNINGRYDNLIASYLILDGRLKEGKEKLLKHCIENQIFVFNDLDRLAEIYRREDNFELVAKCLTAKYAQINIFLNDVPSYADRACAGVSNQLAQVYAKLNEPDMRDKWKDRAVMHAKKYGENPTMELSKMRDCDNIKGRMIDDLDMVLQSLY